MALFCLPPPLSSLFFFFFFILPPSIPPSSPSSTASLQQVTAATPHGFRTLGVNQPGFFLSSSAGLSMKKNKDVSSLRTWEASAPRSQCKASTSKRRRVNARCRQTLERRRRLEVNQRDLALRRYWRFKSRGKCLVRRRAAGVGSKVAARPL